MDRFRTGRRPSRIPAGIALAAVVAIAAIAPGCRSGAASLPEDPNYLCPMLVERCGRCRAESPEFSVGKCRGDILERCRAKAETSPGWLRTLAKALRTESCREFERSLR